MKRILALALILVLVLGMTVTASAEGTGKFVISSAEAEPGEEFQITISIQDNPGVACIDLEVEFEDAALELTKVEKGAVVAVGPLPEDAFPGFFDPVDEYPHDTQPENKQLASLTWFKEASRDLAPNNEVNGTFATLTFKVKADAQLGDYPITVKVKDVHNFDEEDVPFEVTAGTVKVMKHTPGDVNGDGKVNMNDVALLASYIKARGVGVVVVHNSTDVNNDGKINMNDVALLALYIKARGQGVTIY